MRLLTALLILGLSGCATREKYMSRVNTWIGAPEAALISAWGPPHSVYEAPGGNKIYTWVSGSGGQGYAVPVGGMLLMGTQDNSCRTSLEIDRASRSVIKVWADGPGCVSSQGADTIRKPTAGTSQF